MVFLAQLSSGFHAFSRCLRRLLKFYSNGWLMCCRAWAVQHCDQTRQMHEQLQYLCERSSLKH